MTQNDGRHELKHRVNPQDLIQLRKRLPFVARRDEHDKGGNGYRVRSLYFDNYQDKALKEKLDGVSDREKFRLRFYDHDVTFMRLEKKSKRNNLCFKDSALVTPELCRELLSGNIGILKTSQEPLLLELYVKMKTQLLRPKNIVEYRREAFIFTAGNVRITLDYGICTSTNIHEFMEETLSLIPLPLQGVLEVKYDHFLPEIIRGAIHLNSRHSSAFSKYQLSRIL